MLGLAILLFVSCFLIYISWKASEQKCPPPIIQYRYVPRTFQEEQDNPIKPSEVFSGMFSGSDPLVGGYSAPKQTITTLSPVVAK